MPGYGKWLESVELQRSPLLPSIHVSFVSMISKKDVRQKQENQNKWFVS